MKHFDAATIWPRPKYIVPTIGKLIGRGVFSAVYEDKENKSVVYKFTTDMNHADLLHFTDSPMLPKLLENMNDNQNCTVIGLKKTLPMDVLKIERCFPLELENKRIVRRVAKLFSDEYWPLLLKNKKHQQPNHQDHYFAMRNFLCEADLPNSFIDFFINVNDDFVSNYNAGWDFHYKNWMQRENGEIVCVDPVVNIDLFRKEVGL